MKERNEKVPNNKKVLRKTAKQQTFSHALFFSNSCFLDSLIKVLVKTNETFLLALREP